MTSILKSDTTKNGIILKESGKKFEEATSTSGCDLEMSEITSSMTPLVTLAHLDTFNVNVEVDPHITTVVKIVADNVECLKIDDGDSLHVEDVVDGFSIFSFEKEDDLIKFSMKIEKIETLCEAENSKFKKIAKAKKQNKFMKVNKEPPYNEDNIDIYDFQANSESSPSSKNSTFNFKKSLSKKFTAKYDKKFKHKFKSDNTLSPSEENSSSTSVTESNNNLLGVEGRNESPRPTSNDDNNVVSTTTPDNVNIEMEKLEIQSGNLISPLKTASLRIYKLEDELSISSHSVTPTIGLENPSESTAELQFTQIYPGSENNKIYNNQSQTSCSDESKYQPKIIPTKFSVDLLTKITEKQTTVSDCNKCLTNSTNFDWNFSRNSPDRESNHSVHTSSNDSTKQIVFDTAVVTGDSHNSNHKMTSAAVKHLVGNNNCCSSVSFRDGSMSSNGSCHDLKAIVNNDNHYSIEDDSTSEKIITKSSTNSPMQSWLDLHAKGLLHHQYNLSNTVQANSNGTSLPAKTTSSTSFNSLNNSSHSSHSTHSHKAQHDSVLLDWKNNYFDSTKLLSNSVPKYNQNLNSLNHDIVNNIRYQQEQQELMNALRLKHENSKIPKPLVHMGLDSIYKVDHSLYKNPDSRFQSPNVHNYFLPNSQLPAEFNTANVFKNRSDPRSHLNTLDRTSNKDSFCKSLPTISSSNFKTPETVKRRGQWCDMHVKIAYFIYRSQKRMSLMKSQDMNSQLSHLMYSQKVPPTGTVPTPSPYPSSFLQHSNPYVDYRSSQIKPDSNFLNYPSKSSNAFLNSSIRPINPYHSMVPQNIDVDLIPPSNNYEDHHQSPEQKWLRLLSHYMNNHPLSSVDRPNPEILNQLYLWYQQLAQNNSSMPLFNAGTGPSAPMHSSNLDPNSVYLRKYMEHLSSYLGNMKNDSSGYGSNSMSERDLQMYLMKQQQYQKALMTKYQNPGINKPNTMNHMNPLLMNSSSPFYTKKMMEMKAVNNEGLLPQYQDCMSSLVNPKYRLMQDQMRQMKQESLSNHHSRNGFSKMSDQNNPKRRKLNSESLKSDGIQNGAEREGANSVTDLTGDYVTNSTNNNVNLEKVSAKSRDGLNFHLQTVIPDSKE